MKVNFAGFVMSYVFLYAMIFGFKKRTSKQFIVEQG